MDDMIKSKLAINIAQLSLDKATLEAENEELKRKIAEYEEKTND